MSVRSQLDERITNDGDTIIALCQQFVRIPSENPPGDTTAIHRFVTDFLDSRNLSYRTVAPVPEWPNLIASFDGGSPGKHLTLNGHLDVFPAGDPSAWSDDPHSGALKGGRIFGRGVADMKAGTLSLILAYAYLAEVREHLHGRLTLTVVSDEETGGTWGAKYLTENHPEVLGDCLLNGEPSSPYTIRIGEKGPLWLELTVKTRGGHSASPHTSPNAITIAAAIIRDLNDAIAAIPVTMPDDARRIVAGQRDIFDRVLGAGTTDALARVTVSAGRINGGLKVNVIPAHCTVELDIRCPVGVSTDTALARVEEVIRGYPGASYRVITRNEANYADPTHEMLRILQRNGEAVRGIRPIPALSLAFCDARYWRFQGVPAFLYGPTAVNIAAPDEYVSVDDLLGTVRVHTLSAFDYLSGASE